MLSPEITRPELALLLISQIPLAQTRISIICLRKTLPPQLSALRSRPPTFYKLAWEGNRNPCWRGKVILAQSLPTPILPRPPAGHEGSLVSWYLGKHCSLRGHCRVELGEGWEEGGEGEPGCLRCLCLSVKKSKASLQAASLTNCPFNLLKSAPGLRLAPV